MITSTQNPQIKFIRSLSKRKFREENGCFFIEGLRSVGEGIKSGANIRTLILAESFVKSEFYAEFKKTADSVDFVPTESVLFEVTDEVYRSVTETETPQGIGAVFEIPKAASITGDSIIMLENLQDPGNMGTIIRTADAAGFDAIICTKGCVDVYNSKVLRSTTGSVFHIPVLQLPGSGGIGGIADALHAKGYLLYAAHPRGEVSCFDEPFAGKSVIVIGNEANGLSDEMLSHCDRLVTIPMPGQAESLNASVAAALLIYEKRRKNMK